METLKRIFRIFFYSLSSLLVITILLILFLETNTGQNVLRKNIVSYLSLKLGTNVFINEINTDLFTHLALNGITIEDRSKKELLHIGELKVNFKLLSFFTNQPSLSNVKIDTLRLALFRNVNSTDFNFDFIVQAFSDTSTINKQISSSESSMKFDFGNLEITQLHFLMDDKRGSQFYDLKSNNINVAYNHINPSKLLFDIANFNSEGLVAIVKNDNPLIEDESKESNSELPEINIRKISFKNNSIAMDLNQVGFESNSEIGNLLVENVRLNLNENNLVVNKILIDQHSSRMLSKLARQLTDTVYKDETNARPFVCSVNNIMLINNSLSFDQDSISIKNGNQFNHQHIDVTHLQTEISDFKYDGIAYSGHINELMVKEKCGFDINQLAVKFQYADTGLVLNNLKLKTKNSVIDGSILVSYQSLDAIRTYPAQLRLNVQLNPLKLSKRDMAYFRTYAGNNQQLQTILNDDIVISGNSKGRIDNLSFENLKIQNNDFKISLSGKLTGLPNIEKLKGSVQIGEFSGTAESLYKLLPPESIPQNIDIPDKFMLKGTVESRYDTYFISMFLNSSSGDLKVNGKITDLKNTDRYAYDLVLATNGLELDEILKDTLLGNVVFNINVNGKGVAIENAFIKSDLNVPVFNYNGYTYQNLVMSTQLNSSMIDVVIRSKDNNCKMDASIGYSLDSLHPLLKTIANIEYVDLYKLGFVKDSIKFKTTFVADLSEISGEHLNGNMNLSKIEIVKNNQPYFIDSINVAATHIDSIQSLSINAPFLDFKLNGNYEIKSLPTVARALFVDHILKNAVEVDTLPLAYVDIEGGIRYDSCFQIFAPKLVAMKDVNFSGSVNTVKRELKLELTMAGAKYDDVIIDSTTLVINTISDTLKVDLMTEGIVKQSYEINKAQLSCRANDGLIRWNFDLHNNNDSLKYSLSGTVIRDTSSVQLHFENEQLINFEKWQVENDNSVKYIYDKAVLSNLELSSLGRKLSLLSSTNENGLPLTLQLADFPISTLSKLISTDTASIEGIIDGDAVLLALNPVRFTSSILVDSLKSYGTELGKLSFDASNDSVYHGDAKLYGPEMDLSLHASYYDSGLVSGDAMINRFSLAVLDPLIKNYIVDLKGGLNGKLNLSGTTKNPVLTGELNLKNAEGVYKDYNTYFNVPDETINFSNRGLKFEQFIAYDSLKNTATIDGYLYTINYRDYDFDLAVNTKQFLAINNKSYPEQQFYGPASFTADLKINSKNEVINIDGIVKVNDKSHINFELSNADTLTLNNNGVVLYYNGEQHIDSINFDELAFDNQQLDDSKKLRVKLNLEIAKGSQFTLMLNKETGDYLNVYGDANISMSMQPGNDVTLSGKYTIDHGKYLMSINQFVKREFEVVKGGTISWTGSPTDADINLEALYKVETSIGALMSSSQSISSGSQNQRLPFELYLSLKDKMLLPKIKFRLDMPVKDQSAFSGSVYARIKQINSQESELNKQAMSLLVLRQFIPTDAVASANSGFSSAVELTARATAGEIVADQMNAMIASHVKAVDISFIVDARQDYTTGQKVDETDLTINMSKSLFNDRTTVKVGSTFALEGSDEHKHNTSGFAGDVSVEYKLTKSGRYRTKVYSKNQFDTYINSQVVKTGCSFIIFLDFNKYRDIFNRHIDQ